MATIRFRNDKYQVLVRMHGISISKTFTHKIHAQKWARSIEVSIESGQYKEKLDWTVKDALLEYMKSKRSHSHIKMRYKDWGNIKLKRLSLAILTEQHDGSFLVSVRAPLNHKFGADELVSQFPTGGGRKVAAGINRLPADMLRQFISAFETQFPS